MATKEQAMDMRALGSIYPAESTARNAGYAAREAMYVVEDGVLDFFYAAKASFLAIPEIAMLRTGSLEGQSLGEFSVRDTVVSGIVLGVAFVALVAIAVVAG